MKQKLINTYHDIMDWWWMLPFEMKYLMFVVTWMTFIMTVYFMEAKK